MKYAYITALTGRNYLKGCLVLHKSLMDTGTQIPFYVLVPDTISGDVLEELEARDISVLKTPNYPDEVLNRSNLQAHWKNTVFKLKVFELTQFDKIVFLDCDMIVLRKLDILFSCPHMSAVAAGQALYPQWTRLNSGMMVLEPSQADYVRLTDCIDPAYQERTAEKQGFGDQDVINYCFSTWPREEGLHLPESFNVMLGYGRSLKKAKQISLPEDIYIYHFTGPQKPWSESKKDLVIILLRILKRSRSALDLKPYMRYRKLMKEMGL